MLQVAVLKLALEGAEARLAHQEVGAPGEAMPVDAAAGFATAASVVALEPREKVREEDPVLEPVVGLASPQGEVPSRRMSAAGEAAARMDLSKMGSFFASIAS